MQLQARRRGFAGAEAPFGSASYGWAECRTSHGLSTSKAVIRNGGGFFIAIKLVAAYASNTRARA